MLLVNEMAVSSIVAPNPAGTISIISFFLAAKFDMNVLTFFSLYVFDDSGFQIAILYNEYVLLFPLIILTK